MPKTIKLTDEQFALLPGATVETFGETFATFVTTAKQNETTMTTQATAITDLTSRITKLETAPAAITEARVGELVTAAISSPANKTAIETIAQAKASSTVIEASAATGTAPVKPSPAPAGVGANPVADLVATGKYAEAWAASPELKAEFGTVDGYVGYMKATSGGHFTPRNK